MRRLVLLSVLFAACSSPSTTYPAADGSLLNEVGCNLDSFHKCERKALNVCKAGGGTVKVVKKACIDVAKDETPESQGRRLRTPCGIVFTCAEATDHSP